MGRRRTNPDAPRCRVVSIRLTEDEAARLAHEARDAGMTLSGYCHAAATRRRVVHAPTVVHTYLNPVLHAELRRIGNNLNQLAHAAHAGIHHDHRETYRQIHELLQTMLRDELLAQRFKQSRGGDDDPAHS